MTWVIVHEKHVIKEFDTFEEADKWHTDKAKKDTYLIGEVRGIKF